MWNRVARLALLLPLALLINAAVLYWFAYALRHAARQAPVITPMVVKLASQPIRPEIMPAVPAPPPVHKTPPPRRPAVAQPAPAPVLAVPVETVPVPSAPVAPITTSAPVEQAVPVMPVAPNAPVAPTTPDVAPLVEAPSHAPPRNAAPAESRGARAIVHPYPELPDELREAALYEAVTARFHIAADGGFTVELINPSQNIRLNRLFLDTFKRWKFFPAMKDGKPAASEQDMVINMQVQ